MKKILYTVCSANHLAHSRTMVESFLRQHPDYGCTIVLVDRVDGRFDPADMLPGRLREVESLGIEGFSEMAERYSVIELNCAVKAFAAQTLFREESPDILLYLDSDIWVTNPLTEMEAALADHSLLLTPHILSPMPDNTHLPRERDMLRSGVFNAGFLAMRNCPETHRFLEWWSDHMRTECHYDFAMGMGVDQLWLNLAPIFFPKASVFQHPGANVAYWNVHERALEKTTDGYRVNGSHPLLFLHISGYSPNRPERLSRHQDRYSLDELPVWNDLLNSYVERLRAHGLERFTAMPCLYVKPVRRSTGFMRMVNRMLSPLGLRMVNATGA
jgi:hypothetical protein